MCCMSLFIAVTALQRADVEASSLSKKSISTACADVSSY